MAEALLTHRLVKASAGTLSVWGGRHPEAQAPKPARVENSPLSNAVNAAGPGRPFLQLRWKVQKMHRIKASKGRGRSS